MKYFIILHMKAEFFTYCERILIQLNIFYMFFLTLNRVRTYDLWTRNPLLFQLSYKCRKKTVQFVFNRLFPYAFLILRVRGRSLGRHPLCARGSKEKIPCS